MEVCQEQEGPILDKFRASPILRGCVLPEPKADMFVRSAVPDSPLRGDR